VSAQVNVGAESNSGMNSQLVAKARPVSSYAQWAAVSTSDLPVLESVATDPEQT
jgi:hypothetical protein